MINRFFSELYKNVFDLVEKIKSYFNSSKNYFINASCVAILSLSNCY